MKNNFYLSSLIIAAGYLTSCSGPSTSEATQATDTTTTTALSFKTVRISEEGNLWFAYTMADVNGDGLQDFITNNNGGFGGWMGWLEAKKDSLWPIHIVAEHGPTDSTFSASALDAKGMDVGDIDGDGDLDVAANGYWIQNPGGNLEETWEVYVIDEKWHNQAGDWSKNATKTTCYDFDQDGRAEVLTSHSERAGYPISLYRSDDPVSGAWQEQILMEEVPACHTLQVSDIDLDGDVDIVTGINKARAQDLEVNHSEVLVLVNDGQNNFSPTVISEEGIYNGFVVDFEGDGDDDIVRLTGHDAQHIELMVNQAKP